MEKEREERIAEAEIENLSGARHVESEKLAHILAARQLEIKQIPSDGHCMYRALEDQLKEQECPLTVAALRSQTAKYMESHVEDFLPFLTNPNTGDMYTPGNLFSLLCLAAVVVVVAEVLPRTENKKNPYSPFGGKRNLKI